MTGKKQRVREMFDAIAPTYDVLNHILSLGIDRGWRRKVVREVARGVAGARAGSGSGPMRILDVATGTGDLAIAMARRLPEASVVGVDISEGMLALGREKIRERGLDLAGSPADEEQGEARVTLRVGDAEALDFADGTFDVVTAAFGVRNFGDVEAGLREMCRVTRGSKPGEGSKNAYPGRCIILEFSEPRGTLFGQVYRWYFHRVLPWLGRVVSRDRAAYDYLPRSVGEFPAPDQFAEMMRRAGFEQVRVRRLTFGVAYIYTGTKL